MNSRRFMPAPKGPGAISVSGQAVVWKGSGVSDVRTCRRWVQSTKSLRDSPLRRVGLAASTVTGVEIVGSGRGALS